jgi:glycine/D-amino acid oxidase-like deaminating enzyme
MESARVVIVGGGIVGSAAAYFLSGESAFQGRRIVLVERDVSYAQCSTARAVGGLRQQFSTPENIAMSRFTLELIRQLKATFGPEADVAFREQGYLIMAGPQGERLLSENVALQRSNGADIVLLDAPALARRFPWASTDEVAWRSRRRFRPVGRGLVRSDQSR